MISQKISPELLKRLACPRCGKALRSVSPVQLVCNGCGKKIPVVNGKPFFTPVPPGMTAAPKIDRGPEEGSPWRQANWRFLEKFITTLPGSAVILDFGAGHGDFTAVLQKRKVVALDVYPYEEVDIVCDLQRDVPFKRASFDAIVLMNVLEHIQQPERLLKTLAGLLRPGGSLIVAVPFLLKLHQLPYDFYRYSHHQLENLGREAGLDVLSVEGYYDPILLMKESAINIHAFALPRRSFLPRKTARVMLEGLTWILSGIRRIIGEGYIGDPAVEKSPYPIGYHVVYRVRKGKKQ
jgi:SAM-dependent methyltransferase